MEVKYLGVRFSCCEIIEDEVTEHVTEANKFAGVRVTRCWEINTQGRNNIQNLQDSSQASHDVHRGKRPDPARTQRHLETAEIKVLSKIAGRALLDRVRGEDVRHICKV